MRPGRAWIPAALAVAGLAAVWLPGRAENPGPPGFRLDDAWIHMVYGRGLAANGYLAYEDGVPATGCTSPAWAVVLAAVHAALGPATPGRLVVVVMGVGAALHVALAGAAARLARQAGASPSAALLAGGLAAVAPPLAAAGLSGMEVSLTACLLAAGLAEATRARALRAGLWLAAAGLARPESGAVVLVVAALAPRLVAARTRAAFLARLLLPPLVAGAALAGYDLWASGHPLPAAFYVKSTASLPDLPGRIGVAVSRILTDVPPFAAGLGWLAIAGLALERRAPETSPARLRRMLPLAGGVAFVVANLAVLDPVDPAAFYHQRYLLPAAPLLLVAVALGAQGWSTRLPRTRWLAPGAVGAIALVQAALGAAPTSRHLHNDVRNINEVQRRIGEELGAALPPGTRIAASDAGAVRYFSRLPTLDVIGLNTPGMRAFDEAFVRSHPVAALALLPAWFRTPDGAGLEEVFRASTAGYTVTSNPAMATQVVLRARPEVGPSPVRARFGGFRSFALDFVPPERARSATFRGGP